MHVVPPARLVHQLVPAGGDPTPGRRRGRRLPAPSAAEPPLGRRHPVLLGRPRFPVPVRSRTATALPRYFGYGQGLTFYTWTSDQFAQYGTKVIPATVRDATYVLDAILDNETELTILEHTTDTAGYTELVFALFDLLGMQFARGSATWATSGSIGSTPGRPTATWGRCSRARSASGGSSITGTTCCGWPAR